MAAFIIFPSMFLLALLAEPTVKIVLGEKWVSAVVLLQWLALARITYPISVINMNILNARGRSDLFLKVDMSKGPIILVTLLITVPIGLNAIVIGLFVNAWLAFFINTYVPGRLFGYGGLNQLRDMMKIMTITAIMGGPVYMLSFFNLSPVLHVVIGLTSGAMIYLGLSAVLRLEEFKEFKFVFLSLLKRLSHYS